MSKDQERKEFRYWDGNQQYQCLWCGNITTGEDINYRGGDIRCKICGYRVLAKLPSPIVRRVKAV